MGKRVHKPIDGHSINRAIAAGRALAGQTQRELVDAINERLDMSHTRQWLANLEKPGTPVDTTLLLAIAEIQDLPVDFYLYGPAAILGSRRGGSVNPG